MSFLSISIFRSGAPLWITLSAVCLYVCLYVTLFLKLSLNLVTSKRLRDCQNIHLLIMTLNLFFNFYFIVFIIQTAPMDDSSLFWWKRLRRKLSLFNSPLYIFEEKIHLLIMTLNLFFLFLFLLFSLFKPLLWTIRPCFSEKDFGENSHFLTVPSTFLKKKNLFFLFVF